MAVSCCTRSHARRAVATADSGLEWAIKSIASCKSCKAFSVPLIFRCYTPLTKNFAHSFFGRKLTLIRSCNALTDSLDLSLLLSQISLYCLADQVCRRPFGGLGQNLQSCFHFGAQAHRYDLCFHGYTPE